MSAPSAPRLEWTIKSSFVAYVEALPDGLVELLDGAGRDAAGGFVFPAAGEHPGSFTGAVHFRGHHGVLDVTLADPRVEQLGDQLRLTVAVGSERVLFATGAATGGILTLSATDDAAALLGGVYAPGTALDPFLIVAA